MSRHESENNYSEEEEGDDIWAGESTALKKVRAQFEVLIAELEGERDQVNDNVETLPKETIALLKKRQEITARMYDDLRGAYLEVARQCNENQRPELAKRMAHGRGIYTAISAYWAECIERAEAVKQQKQQRRRSIVIPETTSTAPTQSIVVETMRPPNPGTFNGDPLVWPAFKSRYMLEVDARPITPAAKLMYLLNALVGSAKESIGEWEMNDENYPIVLDILVNSYEDSYRLEQQLIKRLITMEKQTKESHVALRKVYDTINNTKRQLESCKISTATWGPILVGLAIQSLPREFADAWEQRRDLSAHPTYEDFMKFLSARAKGRIHIEQAIIETMSAGQLRGNNSGKLLNQMRKAMQGQKPYSGYENRSNRGRFMQNDTRSKVAPAYQPEVAKDLVPFTKKAEGTTPAVFKATCFLCKGQHPLYRCTALMNMQLKERIEQVGKLQVCANCLSKHSNTICTRPQCPRCNVKHHQLLCGNKGPRVGVVQTQNQYETLFKNPE